MKLLLCRTFLVALVAPASWADVIIVQASADSTIYAESGALSNGAGMHFFCGVNQLNNARRGLVRFDVAAALPPGATITSAELVLHLSQQNLPAPATIHVASENWGEGLSDAPGAEGMGTMALPGDATWTERFFGASQRWTVPGGTFGPAIASTVVAGIADWTFSSSRLTSAVQAMQIAPLSNFGFLVEGDEAILGGAMRFDSREHPTASVRPRLLVTYAPACSAPATYCIGAPNSAGPGAGIAWSGSQSVVANAFVLRVSGAPPLERGLFFYGPGVASIPFGDGVRCVAMPNRRLGVQTTDASGAGTRTLDFTVATTNEIAPGSTWYFQFLYRDLALGAAGFNLSNGLQASFCP